MKILLNNSDILFKLFISRDRKRSLSQEEEEEEKEKKKNSKTFWNDNTVFKGKNFKDFFFNVVKEKGRLVSLVNW